MGQQQVQYQRNDNRQMECNLKGIQYLCDFLKEKTGRQKVQSQCNKQSIKKLRDKLMNDGFTYGQLFKFIKQLGFLGLMEKHYLIYEALQNEYHQFGQYLHKEGYIKKIIDNFSFSKDLRDCYTSIRNVIKIYFENPYNYRSKLISAFEIQHSHDMEEHQWKELIIQLEQHFKHDEYKIFDKFKQQKLIEIFSRRYSLKKQPSIASTQKLTKTSTQKSIKQSRSYPPKAYDKSNHQSQREQKQQSKLGQITFENIDNTGLAQQIIQTGPNAINQTENFKQKKTINYGSYFYQGDKNYVIEESRGKQQIDDHNNDSERNQNNRRVQSGSHQEPEYNRSVNFGNHGIQQPEYNQSDTFGIHGLDARQEGGNQQFDDNDCGESRGNQQFDDNDCGESRGNQQFDDNQSHE